MSFEAGSFNLKVCRLMDIPSNILELFGRHRICEIDSVKDEPRTGFANGRTLQGKIDDDCVIGDYLYLVYRIAKRTFPKSLFDTMIKDRETSWLDAEVAEYLPLKVRKEIKQDVIDQFLMRMPVTFTDTPFVINLKTGVLFIAQTSPARIDDLTGVFSKFFAMEILDDSNLLESLPSLNLRENETGMGCASFQDFLLYLWFKNSKTDYEINKHYLTVILGDMSFADDSDNVRGAQNIILKKGCPQKSAEIKTTLQSGKKLTSATLAITSNFDLKNKAFTFRFNADSFSFSGVILPDGEEMGRNNRFCERMKFIEELYGVFKSAIFEYSAIIDNDELKTLLENAIITWIMLMDVPMPLFPKDTPIDTKEKHDDLLPDTKVKEPKVGLNKISEKDFKSEVEKGLKDAGVNFKKMTV